MQVLQRLLEKAGIELHTRNNDGIAMSILDQSNALIKQEFGVEVYEFVKKDFTDLLDENMAAQDGWRAEQIVRAISAAMALKLQRGRSALEDAFGELINR